MRSCGWALFFSLAVHGLIAACIALYFECASAPDELAQLDLTSVELSLAEPPGETAAAAPMPHAEQPKPPEPGKEPPPPEPMPSAKPMLPPPDTTDLPRPSGLQEKVKTPFPGPTASNQQPTPKVDAPPKPYRNIRPDYPRESRLRGEQGDVTLEIAVSAQGGVNDVRVIRSSGFLRLDEAAAAAVRAARFTPAKSEGKPVDSTVQLTLNFRLK